MKYWQLFWTASLIIAGASFAGITGVVTICGLRDLRDMFAALRERGIDEGKDRGTDGVQNR